MWSDSSVLSSLLLGITCAVSSRYLQKTRKGKQIFKGLSVR